MNNKIKTQHTTSRNYTQFVVLVKINKNQWMGHLCSQCTYISSCVFLLYCALGTSCWTTTTTTMNAENWEILTQMCVQREREIERKQGSESYKWLSEKETICRTAQESSTDGKIRETRAKTCSTTIDQYKCTLKAYGWKIEHKIVLRKRERMTFSKWRMSENTCACRKHNTHANIHIHN